MEPTTFGNLVRRRALSQVERSLLTLERQIARVSLRVHAATVALDPGLDEEVELAREKAAHDRGQTGDELRAMLAATASSGPRSVR